jgi:hypothetical protein
LEVQLVFQLPYLMRKGGLCDVQLCCRASEMGRIGYGQKVAEVAQFDLIEVHGGYLSMR